MAQLAVAEKGIVTTSEKYTIAHSNHVGLKFVALKWQNLTDKIDVGDSSSEDLNYRTTEERYTQVVVDRTTSLLTSCRHVLLALFGITRKPELTFLGKPGHAFDQKSTVASI
jgi:hypothetical protein